MLKKLICTLICIASFCVISCSSSQNSGFSNDISSNRSSDSDIDKNTYYKIIWLNYDNSLLYIDEKVVEGFVPEYKGETPFKPSNQEFNYVSDYNNANFNNIFEFFYFSYNNYKLYFNI